MSDTDKVDSLSYNESVTVDNYIAELRLVFEGELYVQHRMISRKLFNRVEIDLREYIRNKCLYELYKQVPERSHDFIREQSKIIIP